MRVGSPRELGLNSPFMLDGEQVQITAIHTDFRFHPSYGHSGDDFYHPSILTHLDGSRLDADQPLLTYEYLQRDGSVTLTASTDEQELAAFSHVVTMELIVRGLEQLQEYIRIYVGVGVDAASLFIPGAPAVITIAQARPVSDYGTAAHSGRNFGRSAGAGARAGDIHLAGPARSGHREYLDVGAAAR
ncbi:MAG: hypothetical protein HND48_21760 [Chloroflexi bacterium]|nr:hypothetical protein [Chloroflexota bacterium]